MSLNNTILINDLHENYLSDCDTEENTIINEEYYEIKKVFNTNKLYDYDTIYDKKNKIDKIILELEKIKKSLN